MGKGEKEKRWKKDEIKGREREEKVGRGEKGILST